MGPNYDAENKKLKVFLSIQQLFQQSVNMIATTTKRKTANYCDKQTFSIFIRVTMRFLRVAKKNILIVRQIR